MLRRLAYQTTWLRTVGVRGVREVDPRAGLRGGREVERSGPRVEVVDVGAELRRSRRCGRSAPRVEVPGGDVRAVPRVEVVDALEQRAAVRAAPLREQARAGLARRRP